MLRNLRLTPEVIGLNPGTDSVWKSWYLLTDARQFTVPSLDQVVCTGFLCP